MDNFIGLRGVRLLAGGALMLFASLSHAQYVWIDEKGLKQFSDRPPPPSVPASKVLKAPGLQPPPAPVIGSDDAAAAPAPAPAAPAAKAPPTLADRNAEYRKRVKEQAEKDQKAAEEAQLKKDKAEYCEAARQAKAQLDSGVRISNVGKDGEHAYITDEERAQRVGRADKVVEACR